MLASVLAAAGLASFGAPAAAGVYKCAQHDATPMYQDAPCEPGRALRDFDQQPAAVSVIPFRQVPDAAPVARPRERTRRTATGRSSVTSSSRERGAPRASPAANARGGNPGERKFLRPGIGEGEVIARVGRPDHAVGGGRGRTRWTYLPASEDPSTMTTLTFEAGQLVHVERKIIRTP